MKSFIALCVLAAICAMQGSAYSPLDPLKDAIESIKQNVQSTLANLGGVRYNLIITASQNMNTLKSRSKTNIENMVRPALDEIRARVDQTKSQGKDTEHCYTTIQDGVHSTLEKTFPGLRMCHMNGTYLLQQAFTPLDVGMETGYAFIPELDNIFSTCYQSDTAQMKACIIKKLDQMTETLRAYQMQVNQLINYAQNGLNNATNTVSTCIMGPESTARSTINNLRMDANKCINK